MGQWLDSITGWLTLNPQWLAAAVFIVAFVECLAIAGLIVPGTVLLFTIAVLAGSGALPLGETLLLGLLGGLLGDAISYYLGRHFHQNIRRLPGLRHHPEWMNGAETYFHKYGIASLLVGRFIGPLRPMLPMVAGMCDMPFPRFAAAEAAAAAPCAARLWAALGPELEHLPEHADDIARLRGVLDARRADARNFFDRVAGARSGDGSATLAGLTGHHMAGNWDAAGAVGHVSFSETVRSIPQPRDHAATPWSGPTVAALRPQIIDRSHGPTRPYPHRSARWRRCGGRSR